MDEEPAGPEVDPCPQQTLRYAGEIIAPMPGRLQIGDFRNIPAPLFIALFGKYTDPLRIFRLCTGDVASHFESGRQDKAESVIGMLANQVDTARRTKDPAMFCRTEMG